MVDEAADHDLRVSHRPTADERTDVGVFEIAAVFPIGNLGGAGFAEDGDFVTLGPSAGALGDHPAKHPTGEVRDFGADHLFIDRRGEGGAVVGHPDGGVDEVTAVGHHREGAGDLQRGDGNLLAHRDAGLGVVVPAGPGINDAADFAGQAAAGGPTEPEGPDVVVQSSRPHPLAHDGHADVGTVDQDFFPAHPADTVGISQAASLG